VKNHQVFGDRFEGHFKEFQHVIKMVFVFLIGINPRNYDVLGVPMYILYLEESFPLHYVIGIPNMGVLRLFFIPSKVFPL
jgi:hypothetical protein